MDSMALVCGDDLKVIIDSILESGYRVEVQSLTILPRERRCQKCNSDSVEETAVEGRGWVRDCFNCRHKQHLTGD